MINSTNINLFFVSTKHFNKKNKSFFSQEMIREGLLRFYSAGSVRIKIRDVTSSLSKMSKQKKGLPK